MSQRVTNLQILGTHRKSVSLAFERHFVKKAHGQIESKKEEKAKDKTSDSTTDAESENDTTEKSE